MNTYDITRLSRDEVLARLGGAVEAPKEGQLVLRVTSGARDPLGDDGEIVHSRTITVVRIDSVEGESLKGTRVCEFDGDDEASQAREIEGSCEFDSSEVATTVQQRIEDDKRFWG